MKIAIFYHIAQMGMSAFIYQSQIHRLYASGLIKNADYIHFGVNGEEELFNAPEKAIIKRNTNWNEETETLVALKEFSEENSDCKILYLHTKGASKGTLNSQSWRLMMEYFVIDRWRDCVTYLNDYDSVGHSWTVLGDTVWSNGELTPNKNNVGHFPGNFWWANSSYIQRLNHQYLNTSYRLDREFWIGTGENYKIMALNQWSEQFCIDTELTHHYFLEKDYLL